MNYSIDVENIKCGGCASSIRNKLSEDTRVLGVQVDIEAGRVLIDGEESARDDLIGALAQMGYPLVGSVAGLKAAASKAKSFVSCAVGRIDNATHKD
jgi:copper chaperone